MALSVDCQRKGQKIIAVKQAIRDQSASIFGHVNDLFQLKYMWFFHGHERNICFTEAVFDWHLALTAGEMPQLSSSLQNKLFEIRAQVLIKQNVMLDI